MENTTPNGWDTIDTSSDSIAVKQEPMAYDNKITFPNGYKISIICIPGVSYGAEQGLFEIAIYRNGEMQDDVHGYLSFEQVAEWIGKVRAM